ncbi:glycosyltransferase [Candidatus Uhrbacteria bacterium]|nr:glycosyltransferase [Candidatus Uhrbacteria bacterium]
MKVSIVIPTKNEEGLLPRLLGALATQTFRDFEIIVADAFSTDRTREIAASMGARVIDGGMPGPGRNFGAKVAKGDLVFFMDADVLPPNDRFLEEIVAEFVMRGADVATCKLKPLSDRADDQFGHDVYNNFVRATAQVRPHAPGAFIIAKRVVHEAIGGFDEAVVFIEDCEYVQRAHKNGFRFRQMKSQPLLVSVRRLEKDGRWRIAAKYLYGEIYMIAKGPFRHMPYEYVMGGEDKKR